MQFISPEITLLLAALPVLNESKINIPNEIALVGFGNTPFTGMVTLTILSIHQFSEEIGKKAAKTFFKLCG